MSHRHSICRVRIPNNLELHAGLEGARALLQTAIAGNLQISHGLARHTSQTTEAGRDQTMRVQHTIPKAAPHLNRKLSQMSSFQGFRRWLQPAIRLFGRAGFQVRASCSPLHQRWKDSMNSVTLEWIFEKLPLHLVSCSVWVACGRTGLRLAEKPQGEVERLTTCPSSWVICISKGAFLGCEPVSNLAPEIATEIESMLRACEFITGIVPVQ